MCHPRDIEKYRHHNPSPPKAVISGDLLNFVDYLIADHTQPGVGFKNSDDLIRHRVFQHIDFDELRGKADKMFNVRLHLDGHRLE